MMNTVYALFLELERKAEAERSFDDELDAAHTYETAADLVDGIGKGKSLAESYEGIKRAFESNANYYSSRMNAGNEWEITVYHAWKESISILEQAYRGEL